MPLIPPDWIGSVIGQDVMGPMGPMANNPATTPLPGQQTGQQANPTFGQRIGGMFQNPQFLTSLAAMLTAGLGGKYGGYAGTAAIKQQGEMQQQEMQRRQVESQEEYRRQQIEVDKQQAANVKAHYEQAAADREATRVAAERLNAERNYDRVMQRVAGLVTVDMSAEEARDLADNLATGANLTPELKEQTKQDALVIWQARKRDYVPVFVREDGNKYLIKPNDDGRYTTVWLKKEDAVKAVDAAKVEQRQAAENKKIYAMWVRDEGSKRGITSIDQMTEADQAEAEGWYSRDIKAPAAGIQLAVATPTGLKYTKRAKAEGQAPPITTWNLGGPNLGPMPGTSTSPPTEIPQTEKDKLQGYMTASKQLSDLKPLLEKAKGWGPILGRLKTWDVDAMGTAGLSKEDIELIMKLRQSHAAQVFANAGKAITISEQGIFYGMNPTEKMTPKGMIVAAQESYKFVQQRLAASYMTLSPDERRSLQPEVRKMGEEAMKYLGIGGGQPEKKKKNPFREAEDYLNGIR